MEELDEGMLKMTVYTTELQKWRPGQHVFLRFPRWSLLDNHAFTIASVPTETYVMDQEGNTTMAPIVFLLRAHGGVTKKLAQHAQLFGSSKSMISYIDGPYGGLSERLEEMFDSVILIAGGSGIRAMLPHLLHISKRIGKSSGAAGIQTRIQEVHLIWSVKSRGALKWIEEELNVAAGSAPEEAVLVDYFVPEEEASARDSSSLSSRNGEMASQAQLEAGRGSGEVGKEVHVHTKRHDRGGGRLGRPDLGAIIPEKIRLGKTCVLCKWTCPVLS